MSGPRPRGTAGKRAAFNGIHDRQRTWDDAVSLFVISPDAFDMIVGRERVVARLVGTVASELLAGGGLLHTVTITIREHPEGYEIAGTARRREPKENT